MKSAPAAILLILVFGCLSLMASVNATPGSHSLMITQVFVVGGSTNSPYTYNYIEVFNAGPVPVDLTDWVLEYQTATGSMGPSNSFFIGPNSEYTTGGTTYPAQTTFPYNNGFNGVLQPGQYLLIQTPSQGSISPGNLPLTADVVLSKSLNGAAVGKPSTTGGKYAIVRSTAGIYCGTNSTNPARSNPTTDPYHVLIGPVASDFVGYRSDTGSTPNCYEGTGPIYTKPDPAISSSKANVAAVRLPDTDGCPLDTNNNGKMDTSTTPPSFGAADFVMMKIGSVSNGWQLHNSASAITNGDPSTLQAYTPSMCSRNAGTMTPTVDAFASVANDSNYTPVTKIEAGVSTQLLLTVTVEDGGLNPTSANGYNISADLSGLGAALVENSRLNVPQKFGYWRMDPNFGNPQYQYPVPPEDPPPTPPPAPVTFTINPDIADKGKTLSIPVSVMDDAQRLVSKVITLDIVGSTPGTATLSAQPATVPAGTPTEADLIVAVTDHGLYPIATSFTVTIDLTDLGLGNSVACPETSTDIFKCHISFVADSSRVGGKYTIPVTVTDDQGRNLTLTPAALEIPVTAMAEPIAQLTWAAGDNGNFGSVAQNGTSGTQRAVLSNAGLAPLEIATIGATGDFRITNQCPVSLAPNASCSVLVLFAPKNLGLLTGSLVVTDNSQNVPASTQTLALSGTGTPPPATADLSTTTASFGNQMVTTPSSPQQIVLTNNGGLALSIASINLSNNDDFTYTTTCGRSLAPAANCVFTVTFKPSVGGEKSATITITDNAAGSPQTVQLSGAGIDFPLGLAPGGSSSATVAAGQTAIFNLQITPVGPFNGELKLNCTSVIQAAVCTPVPAVVNITGPSPVPFQVTVSTTARGAVVAAGMGSGRLPGSNAPAFLALTSTLWAAGFLLSGSVKRRKLWRPVLLSAIVICAMGWTACSGLKTSPWPQSPVIATPPGTYAVSVTATYGTVVRTTTLNLTVN